MPLIATSGKQQLSVIDSDDDSVVWSLLWDEDQSLDENERSWLAWYGSGTDEIKAISDNRFLISSVCGLLATVDRETKQATCFGWAPGAHSVEALPDSFIAAAISCHPVFPPGAPEISGNKFQLYNLNKPREILWECDAYSAHGVIWDEQRKTLWALSLNHVHAFALDTAAERCELKATYDLPSESGHDLAWYDQNNLFVSTEHGVYLFNLDDHSFTPHPEIGHLTHVKGISRHPETGETIYCYPDPGDQVFTSATIHSIAGAREIITAPHPVYKPRWV